MNDELLDMLVETLGLDSKIRDALRNWLVVNSELDYLGDARVVTIPENWIDEYNAEVLSRL